MKKLQEKLFGRFMKTFIIKKLEVADQLKDSDKGFRHLVKTQFNRITGCTR